MEEPTSRFRSPLLALPAPPTCVTPEGSAPTLLARPGTQRSMGVSAPSQGASPHGRSHSRRPNPGHTGVSLAPLLCPCVSVLRGWTVETPGPRTDQEMGRRTLSFPAHSLPPHCIHRTRAPDSRCAEGPAGREGGWCWRPPQGCPPSDRRLQDTQDTPRPPMGSAVPSPAPAPVQAAEGPGQWAALPSAISVHSPCCQTQEADDQPQGVRKDLQTTNLGPPHHRHCRPGLVAAWTPRISQAPPVPMGAEGGSHSPAGFQSHNTHCTLGTGGQGSSEEPGV